MIDVTSIINDPDFVQPFKLIHVTGSYDTNGVWTDVLAAPLPLQGIVLPAKLDALQVLPEGERHDETIAVYSLTKLTIGDMQTVKPDIVVYEAEEVGAQYRVAFVRYYAQCALWYALCSRFHNVT
jgi:hypothetical protein